MDLPRDKSPIRLASDECLLAKRSPLVSDLLIIHHEKFFKYLF